MTESVALIAQLGGLRGALRSGHRPSGGALILRFDDGFAADVTLVAPLLAARGMAGVVGVITGLVGDAGYCTSAQLLTLASLGWEIASHSVSHVDATSLTSAEFDAELDESLAALVGWGLPWPRTFVYPFGGRDVTTDKQVYARFSRCCATTRAWTAPLASTPVFMLPSGLFVDGTNFADSILCAKQTISTAVNQGRVVVVSFHRIITGAPATDTECNVNDFESFLDWIVASGIPVTTPSALTPHNIIEDGGFGQYAYADLATYTIANTTSQVCPWYVGGYPTKFAKVTTDHHSGVSCMEADSARNGAPAWDIVVQQFAVVPGATYDVRWWETVPALTAGTVVTRISYYGPLEDSVGTADDLNTTSAVTDGWVERHEAFTAPAGAQVAEFSWRTNTITGVARLDDVSIRHTSAHDWLA